MAWKGNSWHGMERKGREMAWKRNARQGITWHDMESEGKSRNDMERKGMAWYDMERHGLERKGKARSRSLFQVLWVVFFLNVLNKCFIKVVMFHVILYSS
jgi:hypothetical protein